MLFTGDFYQLKPVIGEPRYSKNPKDLVRYVVHEKEWLINLYMIR
jgi:hypothetical protein